jgi:uncharacterized protein YvpB
LDTATNRDSLEADLPIEDTLKVTTRLKRFTTSDSIQCSILNGTLLGDIIPVPYVDQTILYPTGCESVSATTVLQYFGVDISIESFIDDYLPKADLNFITYRADGTVIFTGMHPNEYFIGNPKTASGLGCYENVIADTIGAILDDYQLTDQFQVTPYTDLTIDDIESFLDDDIPVIVWATQNMVSSDEGIKWLLGNGEGIFQYLKNEHCLVAIGYDDNFLYCNDSLVGRVAYPKNLFEDRYTQMGTRTVVVTPTGT